MPYLTNGVFEHLDITSRMDVVERLAYMQSILIGAVLKKYKAFLVKHRKSSKELVGDKGNLVALKELSTDNFLTCAKSDGIEYDGDN